MPEENNTAPSSKDEPAIETWLTDVEVAEITGLSRNTIRDWRGRSKRHLSPPFEKHGRHARYRLSEVLAWIDGRATR